MEITEVKKGTATVYDLNTGSMAVKELSDDEEIQYPKRMMVLVGPKGVVCFGTEGVGWKLDSMDDTMELDVRKKAHKNESGNMVIPMFPHARISGTVAEIIERCESTEEEMDTFVRTFGSRLECNYRDLLRAIAEIGLDPKEYPRTDRTRAGRPKRNIK